MDNQFIVGEKPKVLLSIVDGTLITGEYTFISDDIYLAAVDDPSVVITEKMSNAYIRFLDYDRVEMESAWYYTWIEFTKLHDQAELNIFEVQRREYLSNILSRLEDGVYIDDSGKKVYLDQGQYFPYLKKYRRADVDAEIPQFKFEMYSNFHDVNTLAFRYNNSALLDVTEDKVVEKCRAFLIDQLRIERESARYIGFTYDGKRFSGDRIVQADITGIIQQYQLNLIPTTYDYPWKIQNGMYYVFNGLDHILDFCQKLIQFINVAFQREHVLSKQVEAMSLTELENFVVAGSFSNINEITFDKTEPTKF